MAPNPSLPGPIESVLASLFGGPGQEFWPGVARLCQQYPEAASAIRRVAEQLQATARGMQPDSTQALPQGGKDTRDLKPGDRVGGFVVLEEIGHGGMGTVYLAEQREPVKRRVALKVVKLGMDTKAVLARFEAERQALAMMDHSHIAKVFEAGATPTGRPYFAMEHVKGVPITRYCDEQRLSLDERLLLFKQVCSGVQHAHTKGVIHRDLTPNNVLVTVQDGKPAAKIIDFGLARATDHRLTEKTLFTEQGVILGTPEYMSPEQAGLNALDVDMRSDVYTLGVLLYELLTGKLPFGSRELREHGYDGMCKTIREVEPPRPSTRVTRQEGGTESAARLRRTDAGSLLKRLRGDLDWITMKSLEKDRTRRYGSVEALAADIARHLEHEPVEAGPPSAGYRLRKFIRKRRGPVTAAAVVLVTLLGAVAVSLRFYFDADDNYRRASTALDQEKTALQAKEQALQRATADREKALAAGRRSESLRLALISRSMVEKDPTVALLLAIEAAEQDPGVEADAALRAALSKPLPTRTMFTEREVFPSPDGRRLLVEGETAMELWSSETGEPLATLGRRMSNEHAADWSDLFNTDGRTLVGLLDKNRVGVWDGDSGRQLADLPAQQELATLGISPDGRRIAAGGKDGVLCVWELAGAEWKAYPPRATQGSITHVCFDPGGERVLITCRVLGTAAAWPATGGDSRWKLESTEGMLWARFTATGKHVVTCSDDEPATLEVWDAASGAKVRTLGRGRPALSRERSSAAMVAGRSVRVWDLETMEETTIPTDQERSSVAIHGPELLALGEGNDGAPAEILSRRYQVVGRHEGSALAIRPDLGAVVARHAEQPRWLIYDTVTGKNISFARESPEGWPAVALDRDGRVLVTLARNKERKEFDTLEAWDIRTGALRTRIDKSAPTSSTTFNFDFEIDPAGSRALSVCWEEGTGGTGCLWDLQARTAGFHAVIPVPGWFAGSGRWLGRDSDGRTCVRQLDAEVAQLEGQARPPTAAGVSRNGRVLVTAHPDGEIRIWDTASWRAVHAVKVAPMDGRTVLVVSDDGRWFAWSTEDGRVLLWRVHGAVQVATVQMYDRADSVRFSPNGERIAICCGDSKVHIHDVATGRRSDVLHHHDDVYDAFFTPTGEELWTLGTDQIWRWKAQWSHLLTLRDRAAAVAFDRTGTRVVSTSSSSSRAHVWNLPPNQAPVLPDSSEAHGVSPDGSRILTEDDFRLSLWDMRTAETIRRWDKSADACRFSPDGRYLVTVEHNLYSVQQSGISIRPDSGATDGPRVSGFFSPESVGFIDTTHLVALREAWSTEEQPPVRGTDDRIVILDVTNGKVVHEAAPSRPSSSARPSLDRRWFVTYGGRTAEVWDIGALRRRFLFTDHRGDIRQVAFSPDGTWLATSGEDRAVNVYRLDTGARQATLIGDEVFSEVVFNPDGTTILTGQRDLIRLWNWSGTEMARCAIDGARSLAFAPRGDRIFLCEVNGVTIWDGTLARRLAEFDGMDEYILDPSGAWILGSYGGDGSAGPRIEILPVEPLHLARARAPRSLTLDEIDTHQVDDESVRMRLRALLAEHPLNRELAAHLANASDLPDRPRRALQQAMQLRPQSAEWLNSQACKILRHHAGRRERYEHGLLLARAAATLRPDEPTFRRTLAWAQLRTGDAAEALRTASQLGGAASFEVEVILALCHEALGRRDLATQHRTLATRLFANARVWREWEVDLFEEDAVLSRGQDDVEARATVDRLAGLREHIMRVHCRDGLEWPLEHWKALRQARRLALPADHPLITAALYGHVEYIAAYIALEADRNERVGPLVQEFMQRLRRQDAQPDLLLDSLSRSVEHAMAGKWFDVARALLEVSLELIRAQPSVESRPFRLRVIHERLAICLWREDKFRESVPHIQQALKLLRVESPVREEELANALALLGVLLLERQEHAGAADAARECLDIRRRILPESWLCFNASSMLGAALAGQGKAAEAEPLLLEGYRGMAERKDALPERVREALQRLVRYYDSQNRPEEAAQWRAMLEKSR